jgi:hypothetical protein
MQRSPRGALERKRGQVSGPGGEDSEYEHRDDEDETEDEDGFDADAGARSEEPPSR